MFKGISEMSIADRHDSYDVNKVVDPEQPSQSSNSNFWNKTCSVSPLKLIFLVVGALLLIALMGILMAMFGPAAGRQDLKYQKASPPTIGSNGEDDKETKPTSNSASTTVHQTQPSTKEQKTTQPSPETTKATSTASGTTESSNVTTPVPTSTNVSPTTNTQLSCDVVIVGGGVPGLQMAKVLRKQTNETSVCVLEKEDYFGGRIYDHTFEQNAPNITVGLGTLKVEANDKALMTILKELNVTTYDWNFVTPPQLEARGVFAKGYDDLKAKAFPTLLTKPPQNLSLSEMAIYIARNISDFAQYSTAETFLSYFLTPEGAKFLQGAFGFSGNYMQLISPASYRDYLWDAVLKFQQTGNKRPLGGMSELMKAILEAAKSNGARTFIREEVKSINSNGNKFVLQTTNFTVTAEKVVLAVTPAVIRNIDGDVPRDIMSHGIFQSIQSVPAFQGAAVYEGAWWNDSLALQPRQQFISSSNCLGVTMPYEGRGLRGVAVLQTMSNNGACSEKWVEILKLSKPQMDKEVKRALEYKFGQPVPDALHTHYKSWDEGLWFFQKPGYNYTSQEIRNWAKRPLTGKNVYLVGSAYYNFGGSLNDAILSAQSALREGWSVQ